MKPSFEPPLAPAKPDHQVLQQAAQWYARLSMDSVDASTREAWQRWHGQDAMHRQAWLYVERISERFAPLQDDAELAALTLGRVRRGLRADMRCAASPCSAAARLWVGWVGVTAHCRRRYKPGARTTTVASAKCAPWSCSTARACG
jgi:transmembrane sensor